MKARTPAEMVADMRRRQHAQQHPTHFTHQTVTVGEAKAHMLVRRGFIPLRIRLRADGTKVYTFRDPVGLIARLLEQVGME